jgi:hypothetical protein
MSTLRGEELALSLVSSVDGDEKNPNSVGSKEGANGVELLGKNLENDEGKGELSQGRAHIGTFESALRRPYFDEPVTRRLRLDRFWRRSTSSPHSKRHNSTDIDGSRVARVKLCGQMIRSS